MPPPRTILLRVFAAAALACAVSACKPAAEAPATAAGRGDTSRPVLAVQLLSRHLRDNDFAAFARDAVPPALHTRLERAWRDGRSRWPLDELPFNDRIPSVLAALAAPDADTALRKDFDRQFSGAGGEIRAAATTLGVFGVQYVDHQGDFSPAERAHYAQLVTAAARWAQRAPLADRARAHAAIARLAAAARAAELDNADKEAWSALGMDATLRRIGRFSGEAKAVLAGYGLGVDDSLDGLEASLHMQAGDYAEVRLRYLLAGDPIDALIPVERLGGQWYVSDFLRHAQAAAGVPARPASPQRTAPLPDGPAAAP
ncbi:hypothetical protein H5368_09910 [Luteimonas sp. MC1782]|uniref:hypothetical protein n=1 Tax=Luteimonas sp. MC1782 TaxID=2760305 RepID=UPI0016010809|nr:hypothetical protein [Luteimonas sp. MC1782]MBB1473349.1 hypothetical protein [Luteimonas sp. MC1782]